jgi:hypothetical protein
VKNRSIAGSGFGPAILPFTVGAPNRGWVPYLPDEPAMTPAAFKRSIRDLHSNKRLQPAAAGAILSRRG